MICLLFHVTCCSLLPLLLSYFHFNNYERSLASLDRFLFYSLSSSLSLFSERSSCLLAASSIKWYSLHFHLLLLLINAFCTYTHFLKTLSSSSSSSHRPSRTNVIDWSHAMTHLKKLKWLHFASSHQYHHVLFSLSLYSWSLSSWLFSLFFCT